MAKRIVIIVVYSAILITLGLVIKFALKPDPTCNDGVRNQGEEQVDCGGPCKPCSGLVQLKELEVGAVEWVEQGAGGNNVAVYIKNPNTLYGVAQFRFKIYDRAQGSKNVPWQNGFILPDETKHLLAYNVSAASNQPNFVLEMDQTSFVWKRFSGYTATNLEIYNPSYQTLEQGSPFFSRANGIVVNNSNVDFENITVKVLLRDSQNQLLAVGQQTMNTVQAGNRREFVINFPHRIRGEVIRVEQEVETNVFDSENYIRIYGQPEIWDYKE